MPPFLTIELSAGFPGDRLELLESKTGLEDVESAVWEIWPSNAASRDAANCYEGLWQRYPRQCTSSWVIRSVFVVSKVFSHRTLTQSIDQVRLLASA